MPVYEYLCPKCNIEFELRRPFSEADKAAVCPKCNSEAQKLISSFGSKTGSYIQASGKPFRKQVSKTSGMEVAMNEKTVKKPKKQQKKEKGKTRRKS